MIKLRVADIVSHQNQNTTLTSVLGLLANLRGPENAFAYANTLANVPLAKMLIVMSLVPRSASVLTSG